MADEIKKDDIVYSITVQSSASAGNIIQRGLKEMVGRKVDGDDVWVQYSDENKKFFEKWNPDENKRLEKKCFKKHHLLKKEYIDDIQRLQYFIRDYLSHEFQLKI